MKIVFTLLSISVLTVCANGQLLKMTGGYNLGLPQKALNRNINPVHSIQTGVLYQLGGPARRFSIGIEGGIGIYAMQRIDQTFTFENNSTAVVPVNYNSNVFNTNILVRYDLAGQEKFFIPYLTAKGGYYSFFSNIYIEDPADGTSCHALQRENIIRDGTLSWTAGAGIQMNTALFAKRKFRRNVMIDISANTVRGGRIDYINTKRLIDAQTLNGPDSKPLQVQFVNASTQNIHEHTVAQVFNSPLRMIEVRMGIVVELRH